jgi:hypothetical protein
VYFLRKFRYYYFFYYQCLKDLNQRKQIDALRFGRSWGAGSECIKIDGINLGFHYSCINS